jgi:hypothetical protein
MIVKGRCRGNGAQLANYLLNDRDNDRAEILAMSGVTSNDPRRCLLEMSLTSELSGRTNEGLYHTQLSPRPDEAAAMTFEQKQRAVEIMAVNLGMEGHKWALFEHEKDGRAHLHLVFERYNHDTKRMWSDDRNYEKHQLAARQMEREFQWEITHEKKNHLDQDVKYHITELWNLSRDARDFVQTMHKAGFEVTQGIDRRPYQIVDQYGTVHDLTRQLQGVKQRDVSNYLNEIRQELRPTADSSQDRREQHQQRPQEPEVKQSDKTWDLSESQTVMQGMKLHYKQTVKEKEQPALSYSYSFKIQQTLPQNRPEPAQAPALPREPEQKTQSDKTPEISESQDKAQQLLQSIRKRNAQRQREQEARQQAHDTTKLPQQGTGLTDAAEEMLRQFRQRSQDRGQEREGPEY